MLEFNNKNTITTSLTSCWCFYCKLGTYFTPFSNVSIVDFEQVNVSKEVSKLKSLTSFQQNEEN